MDRDEKIRAYVMKKQQARDHAAYIRKQRTNDRIPNNGGGGGGGGGGSVAANSYASRGGQSFASKRIIGDPFAPASSSMHAPANSNVAENHMNPPWNNGSRNNFDSNLNRDRGDRDQFDNYDKRSRFGGNSHNNDNFPANNNRGGYGNNTPFGKPRNSANAGFDDNDDDVPPYNNNNNNNNYRGGFNNNNNAASRPVNDWDNTPLPKARGDRNSQFTNNNNNFNAGNNHNNFDAQSAYRGGANNGKFVANDVRNTRRANRNVNSLNVNDMQYALDVPDNNEAINNKAGGGGVAYSRSQSSDHIGSGENSNVQYATADDVKKVLLMVEQLRGQMHALQFQIDNVKLENTKLKQHISDLEETLKQQPQPPINNSNSGNYFQAQAAPQQSAMGRNSGNHNNQFGGSSMHNNRNQNFNSNAMNSMQARNSNGNFGMEIDDDMPSGSNMRMSQKLRSLKDKQQSQQQNGRFGGNSNDNQFNQPFNARSSNDQNNKNNGFDSKFNSNFQPNDNNNNGFPSNFNAGNTNNNMNNNNMDRNRNMNNNNNRPFHDDEEEETAAPPPSSAADLIAKLEQEQGAFVEPQQVQRIACHQCGRKFAEQALQRHIKICKKVFGQKRKKFNIAQQRADEDALKAAASTDHSEIEKELARKRQKQKDKWKAQSTMLRDAIRQSKAIDQAIKEGKSLADIPQMPSRAVHDDRVACPHCGRKFAEETAKRHIPKCQNIKARPTALKRRK